MVLLPQYGWYDSISATLADHTDQLTKQNELLSKQSIVRVECPHESPATPTAEIVCNCVQEVEEPKYTVQEVILVAKTIWGEARDCSKEEQMLVAWCICNRADEFNQTIEEVVLAKNQFHGYSASHPVTDEIVAVTLEVLEAWSNGEEAIIVEPYATTSNYLFFYGDGKNNWFREEF